MFFNISNLDFLKVSLFYYQCSLKEVIKNSVLIPIGKCGFYIN